MRVFNDVFLDAGSMAGNLTSEIINLEHISAVAISAVYTGSPVGTVKVQRSNDQVTWDDVPSSSTAVSAAGTTSWDIWVVPYPYARVVYTRTSGTGSLTVKAYGKGF